MSCLGSPQRPACWILTLSSLLLISVAASAQMSLSVSNVAYGSVQVGSIVIMPVAVTNTGKQTVTISQATVSGTGFSFAGPNLPITVAPQQSARLSVSFAPQTAGSVTGSLNVSYWASWGGNNSVHSSSNSGGLSGTGYTVTATPTPAPGYLTAPSSMNLGTNILVGTSQTQALTLSNSGGSSLSISSATLSGSGFSVSGLTFPYTLAAGSSASLSVTFAPTASGTDSATLTLSSNASDPSVYVGLSGSATTSSGTLGVTPLSMSFNTVNIGTTLSQNGSVTASGGSVTLSSASSSNSQFTLGGLTLPVTIAAGQSVPFTVTFAPTATGTASANISFFTSTSNSASETASGTGGTIQHTVDLSWNASTSTSITGYNVYRGNVSGGPYSKINSALNPSMNYGDSTVQSGQSYYYVTTAVDSTGVESSYSNQVQVVVPFP
jgi:ASPM-SPD-2-Hydin domain-containing protein/HYDIN/CFA65/VesB family protein